MNSKEIELILKHNCLDKEIGYNIRKGGGNHETKLKTKKKLSKANTGKKMSDETKQKISKSTQGKNNHFYGKTHSEETKKKISNYHKNKVVTDSSKLKMSKSQKGKTHSEETKKKISKSHMGIKSSETPLIELFILHIIIYHYLGQIKFTY